MLKLNSLLKTFPVKKNFLGKPLVSINAVNSVNLEFPDHSITGVVGESGSGKSTLARLLCGIYKPDGGNFSWGNFTSSQMKKSDWKKYRRNVQMVFQDPYSSLNPRMKIRQILQEPFIIHDINKKTPGVNIAKIQEILGQVGLSADALDKYPHEFSGGQRQRIAIARALALEPEVIIFDEPVSALDVSIQAQILNLITDIQKERKLTGIFIAHDLSVISYVSDQIAVMYGGRIVEFNTRDEIFENPRHPYTKLLLASIPKIGQSLRDYALPADPVDIHINRDGCPFYYRCPKKMPVCEKQYPERTRTQGEFYFECFHPEVDTNDI